MRFDLNEWSFHGEIGKHSSGMVVSRIKKDGKYEIKTFNINEYESNLLKENYLKSDIEIIKLGLIYQYIQLMNIKEHECNSYDIPTREEIRLNARRLRDREERLSRKVEFERD